MGRELSMTITAVIERLERIRAAHGPDVEVYFDCPHCLTNTKPGVISVETTPRVNMTGAKEKKR